MENPSVGGLADFKARLQAAGLPEEVCQVLMASSWGSTQKRYEGPWKLWSSWCIQRQKCPFSAAVMDILTFLTEQFNSRSLSYRTIGVYKACISQLHDPIEGQQVGNLPLVSRFMKDIFELRTTKPRLCSTWSVEKVLWHFASLEPLAILSLKDLALTSAARAHEQAALELAAWEFTIRVKNSRPYHPSRKIVLARYQANPAIYVVRCLNHYLQWTEQIREV